MNSYSTTNIVEDQYPGVVIENEFVRLVIMPEFGARVLSFLYKPSGHEQFYINPVGTPYGMGDGNFYYDWLMVFGGVFPTFPEPEHGKTWFLPWQWEITEITNERISLTMQLQDTINYPYHPSKFNNGLTGIRCISTVSLQKGKTSFEFEHTIQNTKPETQSFEYWTCATLAPGSESENTFTPENSEIIAPIDYVYLKDDWWAWMGNAEEPAIDQGNHVFEYKNLALYENWEDMGIAYAYPFIDANYYGVINHENEEGVFRVANNSEITSGMKFWTWGAEQGLGADPENFNNIARPYIELWSGLSTQFFEDAYLSPNESITWTETYLPTIAMESASNVNENAAIFLEHVNNVSERFNIKTFTTTPDYEYNLIVSLNGSNMIDLYDGTFISSSEMCHQLSLVLDDYIIADGDYILNSKVYDQPGEIIIEFSIPVTIPLPSFGIFSPIQSAPKVFRVSDNMCKIEFRDSSKRIISVFSVNGQLVNEQTTNDNNAYIEVDKGGLYIIRILEHNSSYSIKLLI
ncbi:MAG: DUF5107 domain-containing protein [Bacteroidetes bacterium]|nr:DUF5107 domain-containing protein [Bacteroidota bacterium]